MTNVQFWLRSIVVQCSRCGAKATKELMNTRNASQGYFCATCGKAKMKELNER